MVDAGIRAVLNFAPAQIHGHNGVTLRSVDLRINLESLTFQLRSSESGVTGELTNSVANRKPATVREND